MRREDIMIEVRDRDLVRRGQITTKYLRLSAVVRHNKTGDWKLTLPGAHPMVQELSQAGAGVVCSYRVPARRRVNLLTNPSFESGDLSGWASSRVSSSVIADSGALFGSYRAELTITAVGFMPRITQDVASVTEGETYTLSGYRADSETTNTRMAIRWEDGAGAQVGVDSNGDYVTGLGARAFVTATAPVGAVKAQVWVGSASDLPIGTKFAWDGLMFERGELDTYVDDDHPSQSFTWSTLFSGMVALPTRERSWENPDGTFTFEGRTDDQLADDARAYPQPSNANVSTQNVANDVRTGAAETLMRHYVAANIGPTAPAARRGGFRDFIALSSPDLARGGSVTKSPRFQVLSEVLSEIGTLSQLGYQFVQRGDLIEFEIAPVADRSAFVRFDIANGTLTSEQVQVTPPAVTRAIVAGQGEGAERTIIERTSSDATDAESSWGRIIERFIDQRDTDDLTELEQSGDEALIEEGFVATNVKVVPTDDTTMLFVQDWNVGDIVTVVVNGQETKTTVTEAVMIVDDERCVIGAAIGDVRGFDANDALTKRVEDTERRVEKIERTVEIGAMPELTPGDITGLLALIAETTPTATVRPFGGFQLPAGNLWCDGSAVSRATYPTLFAALNESVGTFTVTLANPAVFTRNAHGLKDGQRVWLTTTGALPTGLAANTTYFVRSAAANTFQLSATSGGAAIATSGSQSGVHTVWRSVAGVTSSTTFNVPDMRGRTPVGLDVSQTEFDALGEIGGAKTHTLTSDEMPSHAHFQRYNGGAIAPAGGQAIGGMSSAGGTTQIQAEQSTTLTGGSLPHNNLQPYMALNFIIKT